MDDITQRQQFHDSLRTPPISQDELKEFSVGIKGYGHVTMREDGVSVVDPENFDLLSFSLIKESHIVCKTARIKDK